LALIFGCSLVLGFGANAVVAAGHALVADVAASWRNAALNLLDICFGLGLATLPLFVQTIQGKGGLPAVFWVLGLGTAGLFLLVLTLRFPGPAHQDAAALGEAKTLFRNPSFWLLAIALFMYVGAEVSVGKWVVTFMERDPQILAQQGLDATALTAISRTSTQALDHFFETDTTGVRVATYALRSLSFFAFALLFGRLVSSLLLSVFRVNSLILLTVGSGLNAAALIISVFSRQPSLVRMGLIMPAFGMDPYFPDLSGFGFGDDATSRRHRDEPGDGSWICRTFGNSTGCRLCLVRGGRNNGKRPGRTQRGDRGLRHHVALAYCSDISRAPAGITLIIKCRCIKMHKKLQDKDESLSPDSLSVMMPLMKTCNKDDLCSLIGKLL
jgi:hypothetical protein